MIAEPYSPVVGGLERHVQALSRELVRRGHGVTVATTTHASAPTFEIDEGVQVHRIFGLSRALIPLYVTERRFHPTLPDPGILLALRRLIAKERPNIVHAHSWMMYSFLPLKRWSAAKLIVTLHDYSLICPKKTYLHRGRLCSGPGYGKCIRCAGRQYGPSKSVGLTTGLRLSSRMHRAVDGYLAVSEDVRRHVEKVEPFTAGRIEILPSFIAEDALERGLHTPRPGFLPDSDDYILFVGALGRHKGLDVLLEAWASLDRQSPLVLIGTAREDTPVAFPEGVIVAYDVPYEQVMAAWAHCLLAVVPSRSEGSPTVAIEAMTAGRPVIASAVGGLPELVVDGQTGLLVPPGDAPTLRDALQVLLADDERRARMGQAARRRAQRFSLPAAVDRIEQIYADVLARDGS